MVSLGQQTDYIHHKDFPFIIITGDNITQLQEFTDEEFYATSQGVTFKVNRTEIPQGNTFLQLYRDSVLPMVNKSRLQLRKVFIRGAASPEGPYDNNKRLGRGRSQALLDELKRGLDYQYLEAEADISCITEDYAYLCLLMQMAGDKDYVTVKSIYDECGADEICCKRQLMARKTLWNRLLKEYFPHLRAARVILWFSEPDEVHAPQQLAPLWVPESKPQAEVMPLPIKWDGGIPIEQNKWTRRHLIAVRTNLIHDFFYMPSVGWSPSPNIQLEYYPLSGHLTYNLGMTWGTHRHWDRHEFFQMRDFQFELRRYFQGGGRFMGLYMGAFLEGNVYGIGLDKENGWEGEGGGVGLTIGYVMPLTKKKNLRLEFMAAFGFYMSLYDPYVYGNPVSGLENGKYYYDYLGSASTFRKRNHTLKWFGPTNLGIQLTYDIIYRKKQPKR